MLAHVRARPMDHYYIWEFCLLAAAADAMSNLPLSGTSRKSAVS